MLLWWLIFASWLTFWIIIRIKYLSVFARVGFFVLAVYLYLDGWNTLSFENDAVMIWFLVSIVIYTIRLQLSSKYLYIVSGISLLGVVCYSIIGRMDKAFHMAAWILYFLALGSTADFIALVASKYKSIQPSHHDSRVLRAK